MIKRKIALLLAALFLVASLSGCVTINAPDLPEYTSDEQQKPGQSDIPENKDDGQTDLPKFSAWFDEPLAVYYPEQLKDVADILFSTMYYYGDVQTKHPAICMSSETLTEVSLFAINDGKKGDILYTVEKLEPTEALCIFPELEIEGQANIGVFFTAADGTSYQYSIAKNGEGNKVIVTEFK